MSDDFFVEDNKEQEQGKEKVKKNAPKEYLRIELSSKGKLSAPPIVHVRNYNGSDAMELALSSEDDVLETLIDVLKDMIWEDIDPSVFHEKEMEEILMNIYINFWSSKIVDFPYPYTEQELNEIKIERAEKIRNKEEVPTIDIPYSLLDTQEIGDDFKEPFTITIDGVKVTFQMPRIQHIVSAKEYVEQKYKEEGKKFQLLEKKLQYNERAPLEKQYDIEDEEYKEYVKYYKRRGLEFERLHQAFMISKFQGKETNTIEEKLDAHKKIDLLFWKKLNEIVEKQGFFGIKNNIEVISPLTKQPVTRRFQFRFMEFIPAMDTEDSSEYSVIFGE